MKFRYVEPIIAPLATCGNNKPTTKLGAKYRNLQIIELINNIVNRIVDKRLGEKKDKEMVVIALKTCNLFSYQADFVITKDARKGKKLIILGITKPKFIKFMKFATAASYRLPLLIT